MNEIKSIFLKNYRIFNDIQKIDLPSITILTGINSSGKSSIIKSLNLLKNTNYKQYPYTIRFDKDKSNSLSFDLIKNNSSSEDTILFGFKTYNTFLGKNVNFMFSLEKKNDFEGIVNHIQIETENKVILMFDFGENSRNSAFVDLKFFNENLKSIVNLKEKYEKFKDEIASDDEFPSTYFSYSGESVTWHWDETTKRSRKLTEEEISIEKEQRNIRKKEYQDFRTSHPISKSERKWLKDFFESEDSFPGEFPLDQKWNKLVGKVRSDDVLFNHPLLTKLINISVKELNYELIRKEITDYIVNNGLYVEEDVLDRSINEMINNLLIYPYSEIENKVLEEKDLIVESTCPGEPFYDDIKWSISTYMESAFSCVPFYELFNPSKLRMIPIGFTPFGKYPDNLSNFEDYISLVFKKIESDVFNDLEKQVQIPLSSLSVDRIIDFNHPLHALIATHKEKFITNSFIRKWLKDFGVCDDFSITMPVDGLGYSILLKKGKKNIQLVDEGMGTMHLIGILLIIAAHESKNKSGEGITLILEEPEANMHPAWQSKLAELFLDAKSTMGVNFIIETHSEYLIRKFQNLVASKKFDKDDIVIHYIGRKNPKTKHPDVRNIIINQNGTLSAEFGPGFFDEADNLALELMKVRHFQKN